MCVCVWYRHASTHMRSMPLQSFLALTDRKHITSPTHPAERQLAAERKQETEGPAVLSDKETAILATNWREARTALPGMLLM